MGTREEQEELLRQVLVLHINALLGGARPQFLVEVNKITMEGDLRTHRREYNKVHELAASHVSYLGKRRATMEYTRDGGKNTFHSINMVAGFPPPKRLMDEAIQILIDNPKYTGEIVADILLTRNKLDLEERNSRWNPKLLLTTCFRLIKEKCQSMKKAL